MYFKKITLCTITILGLNSCGTLNIYKNVPLGKFNIKGQLYYEELEIKLNGDFTLIVNEGHIKNTCEGKWEIKSEDKLILNGLDTRKYIGIDSLFFKRFDCKNLVITFKNKRKIKRRGYFLKKNNAM